MEKMIRKDSMVFDAVMDCMRCTSIHFEWASTRNKYMCPKMVQQNQDVTSAMATPMGVMGPLLEMGNLDIVSQLPQLLHSFLATKHSSWPVPSSLYIQDVNHAIHSALIVGLVGGQ